jgi:hypothetical protein
MHCLQAYYLGPCNQPMPYLGVCPAPGVSCHCACDGDEEGVLVSRLFRRPAHRCGCQAWHVLMPLAAPLAP